MDDYRAIENLMYRYAFLLDDGDLTGVAELFRHGEIVAPASDSVVKGYDAVLQMYQQSTRLFECGTPRTKHIISNTHIEVNGSEAKARAYFTVVVCRYRSSSAATTAISSAESTANGASVAARCTRICLATYPNTCCSTPTAFNDHAAPDEQARTSRPAATDGRHPILNARLSRCLDS